MSPDVSSIIIRLPERSEINALSALNKFWQKDQPGGQMNRGFVGGVIETADFDWMISRQLIAAAFDMDQRLAGYFLSFNKPALPILKAHEQYVEELKKNGILAAGSRVGIGIQSALEPAWQGTGLIVDLRRFFLNMIRPRFDWIYTTIAIENERSFHSAIRFGWEVTGTDPHYHHLLLKVPSG